jgi:folate-dependent phosphoribosylglycinamide formyltransferase PurN
MMGLDDLSEKNVHAWPIQGTHILVFTGILLQHFQERTINVHQPSMLYFDGDHDITQTFHCGIPIIFIIISCRHHHFTGEHTPIRM